ncbi:hypothetical protein LCGC14_0353770 [marine sediment metagenome]|uniref:DUF1643 domain-containing protein n=1 Tax=marine sediment metagenome TaxID=412755 RepID=A0A0F9TA81_9ZZZZ
MTEPIAACIFSEDRVYRYNWARRVSNQPGRMLCIGVNPSKADEDRSDNTVTRCCNFARREGYGVLEMANLNAFRATDPKIMRAASDPVGPDNDRYLLEAIRRCDVIVVAWGIHGAFMGRDLEVFRLIGQERKNAFCFGLTNGGFPRHPSRLANNTELVRYS